jgi:hypothetical protein
MLRRSSGSGYEKPQSGYALCAVFLCHVWGGGQCFALPYYPPQTSYTAGTLDGFQGCPHGLGAGLRRLPCQTPFEKNQEA